MATQKASMIVESSSGATSVEAFLSGNLSGAAVGADGVGDVSGLDIGAGALPGLQAPGRTQMGGPAWFIMSTQPPEVQAAAWDFMTFMNGAEAQTKLLTGASYLPYRTAVADSPEAQAFFDGSLAGGWLRIANQQVSEIDPAFPGPLIGPYDQVRLALRDGLAAVLFDDRPPADAVRDTDTAIDDALRQYGKGGF
ncbi:MAG: extracellular solute-binding protein [Acidimicrobiales bacterium]